MYLAVTNSIEATFLKIDLDKLAEWETRWQMQFHPDKCQVLSITCSHNAIHHDYNLHGHILEHVREAKYLGVTFTSDLRWNRHIAKITTKANQTIGLLRRNLQINSPVLKTTAYTTLVRPIVEYAPTV